MTEPLLAIFIAWFALGESLTAVQIAGAAVVLTGVLLAERSR
jgi:drug/metabolite transporter (DMT)-like permease